LDVYALNVHLGSVAQGQECARATRWLRKTIKTFQDIVAAHFGLVLNLVADQDIIITSSPSETSFGNRSPYSPRRIPHSGQGVVAAHDRMGDFLLLHMLGIHNLRE
jgi:hypothetical protein